MASLNSMFVSLFIFFGTFAILVGYLPSQFLIYQTDYNPPATSDKKVVDAFNAQDLTIYTYTWGFTIDLGTMKYNQSGLQEGHRIEFIWYDMFIGDDYFEIRHAHPSWFFGLWLVHHHLYLTEQYRIKAGVEEHYPLIFKQNLLNLANGGNSSYFEVTCEHITQNFLILPYNQSFTLSSSWDYGKLQVLSSYEINWDAMKPSAWVILTQIMFFRAPALGILGIGGEIVTYIIGSVCWACFALLIYAALTRLIPFIRGGLES